jgi:hypothetical protein
MPSQSNSADRKQKKVFDMIHERSKSFCKLLYAILAMKAKSIAFAFSLFVISVQAQITNLETDPQAAKLTRKYLSFVNRANSSNYFYAMYANQWVRNLGDNDSLLIRRFLSPQVSLEKQRSQFFSGYKQLTAIPYRRDSLLLHGFQRPTFEIRETLRFEKEIQLNYTLPKSGRNKYTSTPYFKPVESGKKKLPYYMGNNRYDYLDKARENQKKE